MNCSFLPSAYAVYYMLCCACFFCFAFHAIFLVTIPGTEGNKNYPLKMRAIGTRKPEEYLLSWPWDYLDSRFKKGTVVCVLLLYQNFLMYVGS